MKTRPKLVKKDIPWYGQGYIACVSLYCTNLFHLCYEKTSYTL